MIEVLSSDYILLARAKGNSTMRVLFGHALRNALIPIITIYRSHVSSILTGTLTIENIFRSSWIRGSIRTFNYNK